MKLYPHILCVMALAVAISPHVNARAASSRSGQHRPHVPGPHKSKSPVGGGDHKFISMKGK